MVRTSVPLAVVDRRLHFPDTIPAAVFLEAFFAEALVYLVAVSRGAPRVLVAGVALPGHIRLCSQNDRTSGSVLDWIWTRMRDYRTHAKLEHINTSGFPPPKNPSILRANLAGVAGTLEVLSALRHPLDVEG